VYTRLSNFVRGPSKSILTVLNGQFSTRSISANQELCNLPANLSTLIHSSFLWNLGWETRTEILNMCGMVNQMIEVNGGFRDVCACSCNKTSAFCCPRNIRVTFSVARDRAMIIDDAAR
jgi:hypothetical protein